MKKIIFLLCAMSFISCQKKQTQQIVSEPVSVPYFNADSAYLFVEKQVNFGPRTPNSAAHKACGDYLIREMERFGANVIVQETDLVAWDKKVLKARNIISSFNPEKSTRILLLAHWDSRPWADNDNNPANHTKPVDGANDGASGVGVLMEIARQLGQQLPEAGIDILFTDMEDYGEPQFYKGQHKDNSWCLGAQYWAKNPHTPNYQAKYGILLDMVGAPGAEFPKEGYSMLYASHIVEKIWNKAQSLGFGNYFVNKTGGFITDDHVPINQIAGIPTVNIILYTETGFGSFWHTVNDTMKNIDRQTLKAVGQTLLSVIYNERE